MFYKDGMELVSQNEKVMYCLGSSTTRFCNESQAELHMKRNGAIEDEFQICSTKLQSLKTCTSSDDATSFGRKFLEEVLVSLPAFYMRTNCTCMGRNQGLKINVREILSQITAIRALRTSRLLLCPRV